MSALKRDGPCDACGGDNLILWHVPEDIWAEISPRPHKMGTDNGGFLCVGCASERAGGLVFFGVRPGEDPAVVFGPDKAPEPAGFELRWRENGRPHTQRIVGTDDYPAEELARDIGSVRPDLFEVVPVYLGAPLTLKPKGEG